MSVSSKCVYARTVKKLLAQSRFMYLRELHPHTAILNSALGKRCHLSLNTALEIQPASQFEWG